MKEKIGKERRNRKEEKKGGKKERVKKEVVFLTKRWGYESVSFFSSYF